MSEKSVYEIVQFMYNEKGDCMTVEERIIDVINTLRPFLINDGGNIEFVKYENQIVYIRMMGACSDCEMIDLTLKDGIEMAIKEEVPEVKEVVNLKNVEE